ncbi:MAG: HAMP domain-containing histidine kinase [Planctomycetaceae bacterium]|jgi:signal transduction histidine kinase|nr:HAMP domain-containing histidine kinase [Planctomycetaceae bacterium]
MKTTKLKKPPLASVVRAKSSSKAKIDIDDDVFWSDLCSGRKSIKELRERFDAELEIQKLDALAEFAAGAGHEINNPLAIISGHAQLLIREIGNVEHQRKLAVIIAQVKRAYEMIADIRYFARPPLPVVSRFDLVEELNKIVSEQELKLQEIGSGLSIEIIFETKIKSLFIETDQVQLHVAISAICNNSREALISKSIAAENIGGRLESKGDGYIYIGLNKSADTIRISVEDNGIGISPETRNLIFCPYFSGRQAGRGLGFGLPKTWKIMQQLGGTIKTESVKKKSTKFILTIPTIYQ